jgi:hypothetical protein
MRVVVVELRGMTHREEQDLDLYHGQLAADDWLLATGY